jgi:hypothetical protein
LDTGSRVFVFFGNRNRCISAEYRRTDSECGQVDKPGEDFSTVPKDGNNGDPGGAFDPDPDKTNANVPMPKIVETRGRQRMRRLAPGDRPLRSTALTTGTAVMQTAEILMISSRRTRVFAPGPANSSRLSTSCSPFTTRTATRFLLTSRPMLSSAWGRILSLGIFSPTRGATTIKARSAGSSQLPTSAT